MDREYIANKASLMQTKQDLLVLLNEIKADELGEKAYPFTIKQINFYCNPNKIRYSLRYRNFEIPKKSGGKRQISAPVNGLMSILSCVNIMLQTMYKPSPWAMGFTQNRSIVDNARIHMGQNYIFNIDLKDFFPSIPQARVWGRLQVPPFNFNKEIANVLAGLCSMKVVTAESERFILPQGAPTSPVITNMICDKLDRNLHRLAHHFGLNYSRYADDITFSSMHNVYQKDSKFIKELYRIVEEQHFTINESKVRLQKKGSHQEVTGLVISNKVNVARKYTEDIRNILYIWERYGYGVAFHRFFKVYKQEKGHVKKGEPVLENVLWGKLEYLKMVKGETDSVYMKLRNRYDSLVKEFGGSSNSVQGQINYIETLFIKDFERRHNTEVRFDKSKKSKPYAYFMIEDKKQLVSVSSTIKKIEKEKLQISLCVNEKKERYYLVHYPKRGDSNSISASAHKWQSVTLDEILSKLCESNFNLNIL